MVAARDRSARRPTKRERAVSRSCSGGLPAEPGFRRPGCCVGHDAACAASGAGSASLAESRYTPRRQGMMTFTDPACASRGPCRGGALNCRWEGIALRALLLSMMDMERPMISVVIWGWAGERNCDWHRRQVCGSRRINCVPTGVKRLHQVGVV